MSDPPGPFAEPPSTLPPPPPPPAAVREPAAAPPPWGPRGGLVRDNRWIPIVGALVLIVAVGWSLRGLITPGASRTTPSFPTPTPTPAGLEFGRAYLFWYNQGLPALTLMNRTVPAINSRCRGNLPATCQAAIVATDRKLQAAIGLINQGNIPACLATDITTFKSDLEAMDGGLQISLNGYQARDRLMIAQGLAQFRANAVPLSHDAAAVTKDVKALCH